MRKALLIVSVAVFGLSFGCGNPSVSTFTDKRDGKTYKIVKIGGQTWFAENLNYAADGSVCYENNAGNCEKYGRLYNWAPALKACPAGYHLPLDVEWTMLEDAVGNPAGKKLKSSEGWNNNGNGTDDFDFSTLPGGYGSDYGSFDSAGDGGLWWSATEVLDNDAWYRGIDYDSDYVSRNGYNKSGSFSVRCVQDKEGVQYKEGEQ